MDEEVYAQLKKGIADFRLMPGDRFSEHDICHRLAVSRTPVRQALFRLQQEGLVEVMFRSGWRVLPFDFDKLDQLYDLRMVLEITYDEHARILRAIFARKADRAELLLRSHNHCL